MSPEARQALEAVLDDTYSVLVDSVASARGYQSGDVRRLMESGPYTSEDARAAGLVDSVLYDSDIDSLALDELEGDAEATPFAHYLEHPARRHGARHIALINAAGTMMPGRSHEAPGEDRVMGAETMIEALSTARERSAIEAVILRIDSPGGAIDAADDIWREVKRLAAEKPVIVSMSDLAASGGYYIAAPAQRIVAHPATLTGSIGVYGGKVNVLGLLKKAGISVESVTRGARAEMMSPFRDFSEEERARYQRQIDASYRMFLSRVVEGRGLSWAEADSAGRGRVWTGQDALALGLVDTLGGFETAMSLAKAAAGIDDDESVEIEVLPRVEHPWFERMLEDLIETESATGAETSLLGPVMRSWMTVARLNMGHVLALMPASIEIR
jgi:protease-4